MPRSWYVLILAMAIFWLGAAQAARGTHPNPAQFRVCRGSGGGIRRGPAQTQGGRFARHPRADADRVLDSGDKYADRELHQRFIALYDEKHTINAKGPGRAELDVGPDDRPMPIPLDENNGRWTFDTKAGAQTIVDRRIGRNELSAIRTLLACVDAQHDYFDLAKQAKGSGEYATRVVSTPGLATGCTGRWPRARPKARWGH